MEQLQLEAREKGMTTEAAELIFAVPIGMAALPFSLMIPKECDGFTLRFIHVVDAFFPEKRSLSSLTGSFCKRIWMLRVWFSWFICIAGISALLGIGLHTLAWLARDPARVQLKPYLFLGAISLIWIFEQAFCVFMRPLFPLRVMHGYIRDWSALTCYVPKCFCAFAFLVFTGNLVYGLISVYSTLGIRDCIPSQPSPYSSLAAAISGCTSARGVSDSDRDYLLSMVASFGQELSINASSSALLTFLYVLASLVWTTTPLQFAVVMMLNVMELTSAKRAIESQLLDIENESESAESVLKRLHARIVAADIGACRCNEVFGIVVTVNLMFDLSLIAVLLSALQDPEYQKNTVLLPVTAFWMTASSVHICAFLLPIAAYNSKLNSIQTLLYRYSARLNGLTTPSDGLDAWAKPLNSGLLKRLHHKVTANQPCGHDAHPRGLCPAFVLFVRVIFTHFPGKHQV